MGMDFVDFQVESEITMSDVPSENDIWMEARSPAGGLSTISNAGKIGGTNSKEVHGMAQSYDEGVCRFPRVCRVGRSTNQCTVEKQLKCIVGRHVNHS